MSKRGGYFRGKVIKSAQQAPGAAEERALSASAGCDRASAIAQGPGRGEGGRADKVLVQVQPPEGSGGIGTQPSPRLSCRDRQRRATTGLHPYHGAIHGAAATRLQAPAPPNSGTGSCLPLNAPSILHSEAA